VRVAVRFAVRVAEHAAVDVRMCGNLISTQRQMGVAVSVAVCVAVSVAVDVRMSAM